jgi:hypothetical protein
MTSAIAGRSYPTTRSSGDIYEHWPKRPWGQRNSSGCSSGLRSGVRNAPTARVQAAVPSAVDEGKRDRLASRVRPNGDGRGKPATIPDGAGADE